MTQNEKQQPQNYSSMCYLLLLDVEAEKKLCSLLFFGPKSDEKTLFVHFNRFFLKPVSLESRAVIK